MMIAPGSAASPAAMISPSVRASAAGTGRDGPAKTVSSAIRACGVAARMASIAWMTRRRSSAAGTPLSS